MTRVKRGNIARKKRKKILKLAKGFTGSLSKIYRAAKPAVFRALKYAYRDRRNRKRDFRKLWIARINAALLVHKIPYSRFINMLLKKNVKLNRKVLAELAYSKEDIFSDIVGFVK